MVHEFALLIAMHYDGQRVARYTRDGQYRIAHINPVGVRPGWYCKYEDGTVLWTQSVECPVKIKVKVKA